MNSAHRVGVIGWIFVLTFTLITLVAQPALADATSDAEACFLSKINAARTANGAQALQVDSTLAGYARIHSKQMADNGSIYHSSAGDLDPYLPSDWLMWGENVGVGGSCDVLFDAFWSSSHHRENLLNPDFQYAGIGVFIDGSSVMWTTHIFLERQVTTTTTAPPATTTTAPPSTTTTTKAPITTTTTTGTPITTTTTMGAPATATTTTPPTTTTTTTPSTTTTTSLGSGPTSGPPGGTQGAVSTGVLGSIVQNWETGGVLCSDGGCGGDQVLLAFIGVVLLSGTALTTWALRA